MLSAKSVVTALGCHGCRFKVVATFAASVGVQLQPLKTPPFLSIRSRHRQQRTFAAITTQASEQEKPIPQDNDSSQGTRVTARARSDGSPPKAEVEQESPEVPSVTYTPWYLQEHAPHVQQAQNPFADRQRISDLPNDPPPSLLPILQHISTDLGLDDLSLLDLRNLDPPPALGSNLIMIVGTARSEKHLHVSADRLCRWLRTTYKLQPFADGLLGRNEMKLKLRRKAKRAKIMRNAGASEPGGLDDDLRSGWVCVNIGRVETAISHSNEEETHEDTSFVGFGPASEGVRLVVQMFTEEKRGHFDLETLWGGVLRREAREREKERDGIATAKAMKDDTTSTNEALPNGSSSEDHRTTSLNLNSDSQLLLRRSPGLRSQQMRVFHSSSRIMLDVPFPNTSMGNSVDPSRVSSALIESEANGPRQGFAPFGNHSANALQTLLDQLHNTTTSRARQILGDPWTASTDGSTQNSFVHSFAERFPSFPETLHWQKALELFRRIIELRGIGRKDLFNAMDAMHEAGEEIPRETYLQVLETIVTARPDRRMLHYAIRILDMMTYEGHPIFNEEIFLLLHKMTLSTKTPPAPIVSDEEGESSMDRGLKWSVVEQSEENLEYKERVLAAMDHFVVHLTDDASWLSLLRFYASGGHWSGFSYIWSSMARRMVPRSQEMYLLFYTTLAGSRDRELVRLVLQDAIADMEAEQPPVHFERELAERIAACIQVMIPDVAERVSTEEGRRSVGPWGALWGRCQRALQA
ncbi:MAG: ATPase synthesis protein 25 mitochondrial [Bathelium mastoideum]|nr:MAG: ATPase synthesis protein 25 mitochondrial [Bathelium mastoideum]